MQDVYASAEYEKTSEATVLTLEVKPSVEGSYKTANASYKGLAVRHNAGMWIVGRGFLGGYPNSLQGISMRCLSEDMPG